MYCIWYSNKVIVYNIYTKPFLLNEGLQGKHKQQGEKKTHPTWWTDKPGVPRFARIPEDPSVKGPHCKSCPDIQIIQLDEMHHSGKNRG